jgi:hypothetical protein
LFRDRGAKRGKLKQQVKSMPGKLKRIKEHVKGTHVISGDLTFRIVVAHVPLVQGGDGKVSLALRLRDAGRVREVGYGTTGEFENPGWGKF